MRHNGKDGRVTVILKINGVLESEGHFVVSDGQQYMDPGHNTGEIVNHFPNWKSFYDTGLTVVVG